MIHILKARQASSAVIVAGIMLYMVGKAVMTIGGMILTGAAIGTVIYLVGSEIRKKVDI